MQKAPKIAIERLRATPLAVNHPDADLLTAFSERSLPEAERGMVLEHLALCGECREVVALAVPEEDLELEAVEGSAVGGWFTWNAMRWGLVTAGLLVAGFGVLQYQKHARPEAVALNDRTPSLTAAESRNESPSPDAAREREKDTYSPGSATPETSSVPSETVSGAVAKQATLPTAEPTGKPKSSGAAGGLVSGTFGASSRSLAHGPLMNQNQSNQIQSSQINQANGVGQTAQQSVAVSAPSANLPVNAPQVSSGKEFHGAAASTTASAPPAGAAVTQQTLPMSGRDFTELMPLQNQRPDQQSQDASSDESKVERVKPLDSIAVSSSNKVLRSSPRRAESAPVGAMAVASWTISSSGGLQRSFDQGNSWQDVNVNASPAMYASSSLVSVRKESAVKLDDKGQSNKGQSDKDQSGKGESDKKKSAPPIVFRAVAANGADVWAGGSAGRLYHSIDSGANWAPIFPFTATAILTGDIVSVEFADPQHGKVTTSTSETWLTADGGNTWLKQ